MKSAAIEPWETRNTKTVSRRTYESEGNPQRDLMLSIFCFIVSLPILGMTLTGGWSSSLLFISSTLLIALGAIFLAKSMRSVGEEKIVFDNRETISTFDPEALHDRIRSIAEK